MLGYINVTFYLKDLWQRQQMAEKPNILENRAFFVINHTTLAS